MLGHPFVRGIGDGTLPEERFRFYVRQDFLFLTDYGRLLALGAARAPRLEWMRRFASLAGSVLETEMDLHRQFAARWGITSEQLEAERTAPATDAYTHFLLRTASLGDFPELVAALLPCMWSYAEIGYAARGGRPARPRGLRRVGHDVRLGGVRAARDLVPGAGRRGRRRRRGTRPAAHARGVPRVHGARDRVLGQRLAQRGSLTSDQRLPASDLRALLRPAIPTAAPRRCWPTTWSPRLLARLPSGARVVDVGCGPGDSVDLFRAADPAVRWVGVDLEASPEVALRTRSDAEFRTFDGLHLPFADGEVDLAFCKQVLEHVERPHELLADVARVLAPGGRLAGSTSQLEPFHSRSTGNWTAYGIAAAVRPRGARAGAVHSRHRRPDAVPARARARPRA